MAYRADNEVREELGVFDKNDRGDKVSVTKITTKDTNKISFDIRNMYTTADDELRFTQKGVRLNSEMTVDVVKALLKGLDESEVMDVLNALEE